MTLKSLEGKNIDKFGRKVKMLNFVPQPNSVIKIKPN